MAPASSSNGAARESQAIPLKKRGRPPKPKGDTATAEASTSKKAAPKKVKAPAPNPQNAESSAREAMQIDDNQLQGAADSQQMELDEESERNGQRGRSEIQHNLFEQDSAEHTPIESVPDTSMLAATSKKKPGRLDSSPHKHTEQDEALIRGIAEEVQKLQNAGEGSSRAVGASKETRYRSQATGAAACYMGPIQSQTLQSVAINTGRPLAELVDDARKPGALFNLGGHIYSVDWLPIGQDELQYLCVSASLEKNPRTVFGERLVSEKRPARLQIWSINDSFQANLRLTLCFEQGWISSVRWLPMSTTYDESPSTLGLLSACMQDGSVGIYAVPRASKEGDHIKIDPLVELNVKKGVPTAMEWFDASKLAIAYSDGWVSVWNLFSCLKAKTARARPLVYTRVSTSPITSLAWHSDGEQLFVSSFDGSMRCLQLAHPQLSTTIYHSREVSYSVVFSSFMGFPLMERPEADDVRSVDFSKGKSQTTTLYSHLGRVRAMSVSPHHSYVASGSVDGTVKVVDLEHFLSRSGKKSRKAPKSEIVMPLFRLDKNRGKEALRFIENLAPQSTAQQAGLSSAAWDPEISLTAVRWNCNEGKEAWVVSTMACGLMRVDVVDL